MTALVLVLAALGGGVADRDCGDFATQASAQAHFDARGYGPGEDPERLDADGDGLACETNPCPCATAKRPARAPAPAGRERGTVVRVVDGDTVRVRLEGGGVRSVRLIGIDAPESSSTRFGRPQCGGREARGVLRSRLPRGTRVVLTQDPSQGAADRFGRPLRYLTARGEDTGRGMVRSGWALPFVVGTPFARLTSYERAASDARRERRGIHGRC